MPLIYHILAYLFIFEEATALERRVVHVVPALGWKLLSCSQVKSWVKELAWLLIGSFFSGSQLEARSALWPNSWHWLELESFRPCLLNFLPKRSLKSPTLMAPDTGPIFRLYTISFRTSCTNTDNIRRIRSMYRVLHKVNRSAFPVQCISYVYQYLRFETPFR